MPAFEIGKKAIDDGFFTFSNNDEAQFVFDQILEFFIVFLDFYSIADKYEPEYNKLPEYEQPVFDEEDGNDEGKFALLYTDYVENRIEVLKRQERNLKNMKDLKMKDEEIRNTLEKKF